MPARISRRSSLTNPLAARSSECLSRTRLPFSRQHHKPAPSIPTSSRAGPALPLPLHREVLGHEVAHPAHDASPVEQSHGLLGRGDPPASRADPHLQAQRTSLRVALQRLHQEERGRDTLQEEGGVRPEGGVLVVRADEDGGLAVAGGRGPTGLGSHLAQCGLAGEELRGAHLRVPPRGSGVLRLIPGKHGDFSVVNGGVGFLSRLQGNQETGVGIPRNAPYTC
jgi:hypothetical protein